MDRNTLGSSFNKLAHAQSTPVGMDGTGMSSKTPPLTPRKSGKMLAIPVLLLDDTTSVFQVQSKANGRVLFEQVCKQLNLLESDYFGLEYQHSDAMYWLDLEKPLHRQVGLSLVNPTMKFCVKFYTPDPSQLEEEYTRYLFCLQIKRDLMQGDLQCNDNTAALIISYIVQAECGDYASEDYPDHTYLSSHKFVPHQDKELEFRIMENHKKHVGQSPAEADLNLLETARRCECYGMKMHPAKDQENVLLNLAVAHMGIVVFQNYTKINTFSWAKIRKISFKRKRFLIKLHPEGYGYYKDVVEFLFSKRDECKSFWKKCVENHTFFRCAVVKPVVRQKPRVLTRGSSFRYSGRTQKQIVQYVRENYVKRQTFQRSQSLRHPNSVHSSSVNVGTSISAHPLLPLGDKTTAGSGASLSCGSMTLSGSQSPTTRQAVGPQVAMTTTTTTTSAINQIRQQQIPADVYEPITTSSDITSIASSIQSPQHVLPSENGFNKEYGKSQQQQVENESSPVVDNGIVNGSGIVIEIETTPSHKTNGVIPNSFYSKMLMKANSDGSDLAKFGSKSLSRTSSNNTEEQYDNKRKRSSEKSYFIVKELSMTERTYKKDLEVISISLRDEFNKEGFDMQSYDVIDRLLGLVDPIYDAHCVLLHDLEDRIATWNSVGVGDILRAFFADLSIYDRYMEDHCSLILELNNTFKSDEKFENLYREFECQKLCYLPLTMFTLKPFQRLLYYSHLLDRLLKYYNNDHIDYEDAFEARASLRKTAGLIPKALRKAENLVLLIELSRDVTGVDSLCIPDREFIRHGCLTKFSQRKGYQQRMFLLFSDVLLYTNRTGHLFRVHGELPLSNITIEERPDTPQQHSFSIFAGNRVVTVAAASEEEKDKWLEDLTDAIHRYKIVNHIEMMDNNSLYYYSLRSCSSSDDLTDRSEDMKSLSNLNSQRSNTAVHVCWHRNTSISMDDHLKAVKNQLSGYLLRKFKNSNGWQKLWVVFTNLCLFFYKTHQENRPLASLPLLGYNVTTPTEEDAIHKDSVFKLQFKNHVYFFRAESEYIFNRWMEVIGNATQHAGRHRLFSRNESAHLELS